MDVITTIVGACWAVSRVAPLHTLADHVSKRSQNEPLAQLFGRRLRALREAKQLTQEQLGKAAGVDYKHVGAVERGTSVPSFEAVERIAGALGADYYELFLPDRLEPDDLDRNLKMLLREIERRGNAPLKRFVSDVLAAGKLLAETNESR